MRLSMAFRRAAACALVVAMVGLAPTTGAASALWSKKFDQEITWHRVSSLGTLLVGTKTSLQSLDPQTGSIVWSRDDLKGVTEVNVEEIEGTPYLYVGQNIGKIKVKTKFYALDLTTGETVWETEQFDGYSVGYLPVPHKGYTIVMTIAAPSPKSKLDLMALDVATGEAVWTSRFDDKVDLHLAESSGKMFQRFDLTGHPPAILDDDSVYFPYDGLARFDLASGKQVWAVEYDVTAGTIKRGNAEPILENEIIYTSARGQLRAIGKADGALKWTSKDFGGAIAEMAMVGDVLYARLGGNFYDKTKKSWVIKKPLGVVAVNKGSGEEIWRYTGAKGSITNMAILDEQNTILIADEKNLIGLDTNSTGKVKESFKLKLEFKHKLGAAAATAKVMKGLTGGFGRGKKKKGAGDDRTDNPVAISMREDGRAVVRGKQHVLCFDPKTKGIAWSSQYAAPGASGWVKLVMASLSALSYAEATGRAMGSQRGTMTNKWANQDRFRALDNYERVASKRFTASAATDKYAYVLTSLKEGKEKGSGIIGVNMDTGTGDRQVLFKDKDPNYKVDEVTGRVFNVKDGKELSAFQVQ